MASMGRFRGLLEEIELLGKVTGGPERAAELVGLLQTNARELGREPSSPSTSTAGRGFILLSGGSLIRTPVSYEPVDKAGGRNVANGLLPSYLGTIGAIVNLEQIIRWDPDIILIQGSFLPKDRMVTVRGVLEDSRLRLGQGGAHRRRLLHFRVLVLVGPGLRPGGDALPGQALSSREVRGRRHRGRGQRRF